MAIIRSFLCWSNTRTGSAVCGYYTLVISVVCLALYMIRYVALDEIKDKLELKGMVYAGFVLYSFLIGVSLILLPGVYMDRRYLLLPWICLVVITILYEMAAIALITTVHLEHYHTLNAWEIVAVAFYCLRLIANCYGFACVVSQYQELSEGRGTHEFLHKPRRRRVARGAHLADCDEYNPPYGATLPPYSHENPYKEYCPPTYENLALEGGSLQIFVPPMRDEVSAISGRMRNGDSFSYLVDVVVNPQLSSYDPGSEAMSGDGLRGYSYNENDKPYSSGEENFEDASDHSLNPRLSELSGHDSLSTDCDYQQFSNHTSQQRSSNLSSCKNNQHRGSNLSSCHNNQQRGSSHNNQQRGSNLSSCHNQLRVSNLSSCHNNQQSDNNSYNCHSNHRKESRNSYNRNSNQPMGNNLRHYHNSQQESNISYDSCDVSVTSSSAYLMDYTPYGLHKSHKPKVIKQAPLSPLLVQKRTYITWI